MTIDERIRGERMPSTAEKVAERLREEMLCGALPQGARLREVALSESMRVSRRTVREALLILAEQRLVSHERHRGAVVRTLSRADVADLYQVRRTLELQGARNAPFAAERERNALGAAYERLREALLGGHSRATVHCDLAFHGAVVGLVASPRLDAFYEQVSSEMEMALMMIRGGEERRGLSAEQFISEHRTIRDLLLARDVVEAQRAILAHIDLNERFLLSLIDGGSAGDDHDSTDGGRADMIQESAHY